MRTPCTPFLALFAAFASFFPILLGRAEEGPEVVAADDDDLETPHSVRGCTNGLGGRGLNSPLRPSVFAFFVFAAVVYVVSIVVFSFIVLLPWQPHPLRSSPYDDDDLEVPEQ